MKHCFDTEIAKEVGINAAIIYENLRFWIDHNAKKGVNKKEGKYWMYTTQKELSEQFEYLSVKQVRTALEKLENAGYIVKGNFNRSAYDRTTWYSLTEKGNQPEETPEAVPETETPEKAPEKPLQTPKTADIRKYPNRRKQKPAGAIPEPPWIFGDGAKGRPIQDIESDLEKNIIIENARLLAEKCGAVCTL